MTDEDLERLAPIFPPNPADRAEAKRHAHAYTPEAHIGGESLSITFCPQPVVYESVHRAVHAVARLHTRGDSQPVTIVQVAKELKLDRSAASRRVRSARDRGYLRNLEDNSRNPSRLVPGDPLPEDLEILPLPDKLEAYKACKRAVETGGRGGGSPPQGDENGAKGGGGGYLPPKSSARLHAREERKKIPDRFPAQLRARAEKMLLVPLVP